MGRAHYLMVGGFLGAGKTTAVLRLARHLTDRGVRVGVITNDQSTGLVDTEMVTAGGYPVQEITGGCFCCRFNSLVEASRHLSREAAPDVFVAEPVGSCTDLKATVSYPLRRIYGEEFRVAPLSVLADPDRALRMLGVETGRSFSSKVQYVYRKQLEEADLIIVNKIDLLTDDRRAALRQGLGERYPAAEIFEVSARDGVGLEPWFDRLLQADAPAAGALEIDYDVYAEGEALLGWLNATLDVRGTNLDGNTFLMDAARDVQRRLATAGAEVAHLKMTLAPDDGAGELAVVNLVGTDRTAALAHALDASIDGGELIVNLRAEADPELLRDVVIAVFGGRRVGGQRPICMVTHLEHFRPGRPAPTHRMAVPG